MAENVIEKEAAEKELQTIIEFFEVDPEGIEWVQVRPKLLAAIQKGRVVLDEAEASVIVTLVTPIEQQNGATISEMKFHEPTGVDLKVLDKYKPGEGMAKTIHLVSKMSGQPIGIVERLGARDLQVLGGVAALFF